MRPCLRKKVRYLKCYRIRTQREDVRTQSGYSNRKVMCLRNITTVISCGIAWLKSCFPKIIAVWIFSGRLRGSRSRNSLQRRRCVWTWCRNCHHHVSIQDVRRWSGNCKICSLSFTAHFSSQIHDSLHTANRSYKYLPFIKNQADSVVIRNNTPSGNWHSAFFLFT